MRNGGGRKYPSRLDGGQPEMLEIGNRDQPSGGMRNARGCSTILERPRPECGSPQSTGMPSTSWTEEASCRCFCAAPGVARPSRGTRKDPACLTGSASHAPGAAVSWIRKP
jgi:hypothetical protein